MQTPLSIIGSQMALVTMTKGAAYDVDSPNRDAAVALVRQLTFAIAMSQPTLTGQRLHMAHFTSDLFFAGEIDVAEFLGRMERLFPNRMEDIKARFAEKIRSI